MAGGDTPGSDLVDALDGRDQARAQLAAIRHALDGTGHVAPGDYAWSPELERVRKMRRLLNLPEVDRDRRPADHGGWVMPLVPLTIEERATAAKNKLRPYEWAALRDVVAAWLNRQRVLGLISDEGVRVVERLMREIG